MKNDELTKIFLEFDFSSRDELLCLEQIFKRDLKKTPQSENSLIFQKLLNQINTPEVNPNMPIGKKLTLGDRDPRTGHIRGSIGLKSSKIFCSGPSRSWTGPRSVLVQGALIIASINRTSVMEILKNMNLELIAKGKIIQRLSILLPKNPKMTHELVHFVDQISSEDFVRFLDADWLKELLSLLISNLQSKQTELLNLTWPLLARLVTKIG